jgi:hypothetical protein
VAGSNRTASIAILRPVIYPRRPARTGQPMMERVDAAPIESPPAAIVTEDMQMPFTTLEPQRWQCNERRSPHTHSRCRLCDSFKIFHKRNQHKRACFLSSGHVYATGMINGSGANGRLFANVIQECMSCDVADQVDSSLRADDCCPQRHDFGQRYTVLRNVETTWVVLRHAVLFEPKDINLNSQIPFSTPLARSHEKRSHALHEQLRFLRVLFHFFSRINWIASAPDSRPSAVMRVQ